VFAPNGVLNGTGLPGGCTRDLVHRFYQEQYQLNDGRQNRYVTGSDAVGLTMGVYHTRALPIYRYLHRPGHPRYAIADNFFQAAFGGSFLNHQWLIAASNPVWPDAVNDGGANDLHSVVDANGMPTSYPLYASLATTGLKDAQLTASCDPPAGAPPTPPGVLCGDYAVNTIQPPYQPFAPGTAVSRRLPPQTAPTIGDRLSGAGIDWAWYSGGWSNANGDVDGPGWTNGPGPACSDPDTLATAVFPNCPDKLFQFHHQAFNYYANYAPGTAARAAHLRDEQEFLDLAQSSDKACDPDPGAGDLAGAARQLRGRPHPVRHHLDRGHDRAALRPRAARLPRCRRPRPVPRLPRQEAAALAGPVAHPSRAPPGHGDARGVCPGRPPEPEECRTAVARPACDMAGILG
jgi:phospholipase C